MAPPPDVKPDIKGKGKARAVAEPSKSAAMGKAKETPASGKSKSKGEASKSNADGKGKAKAAEASGSRQAPPRPLRGHDQINAMRDAATVEEIREAFIELGDIMQTEIRRQYEGLHAEIRYNNERQMNRIDALNMQHATFHRRLGIIEGRIVEMRSASDTAGLRMEQMRSNQRADYAKIREENDLLYHEMFERTARLDQHATDRHILSQATIAWHQYMLMQIADRQGQRLSGIEAAIEIDWGTDLDPRIIEANPPDWLSMENGIPLMEPAFTTTAPMMKILRNERVWAEAPNLRHRADAAATERLLNSAARKADVDGVRNAMSDWLKDELESRELQKSRLRHRDPEEEVDLRLDTSSMDPQVLAG